MPHHVYANNNEIATKSADGKSTAAAPDVCFTTPPSVAAGTPVPFTNTCEAKDITNGSKTVFMKRGEVALEDKSFFKKSTGDEGATDVHKKGIISGKITGKCYFIGWSPNVKVEGLCVARHMDSVTHNHSNPANAMIQKYKSVFDTHPDCKGDKDKMEKKCAPLNDEKKDERKNRRKDKGLLSSIRDTIEKIDDVGKDYYGYTKKKPKKNSWMDDYCGGMWVKPGLKNLGDYQEQVDDFKGNLEGLGDIIKANIENKDILIKNMFGKIYDLASPEQIAEVMGERVAESLLLGRFKIGKIGKLASNVIEHGLSNALDMDAARDLVNKLGSAEAEEWFKNMEVLVGAEEKLQDLVDKPDKLMGELMSLNGEMDSCLKARKCKLVPYKNNKKKDVSKGDGCCPGQTGHHIIPDVSVKNAGCQDYDYQEAPTICLEGTDNIHGSHGRAHVKLKKTIASYGKGKKIPYESMRDKSMDSVKDSTEQCDQDCLLAQLDAAYDNCDDLVAHDGGGGPWSVDESGDDNQEDND